MTVIIPHQDDQLKLRNFQKSLISLINKKADARGCAFYEQVPLWVRFEGDGLPGDGPEGDRFIGDNIRDLGKRISKIEIAGICGDGATGEIFLTVKVNIGGGETVGRLPLASAYKKENSPAPDFLQDLLKNISLKELPSGLKIFRLGNAIKSSKNSMAISDSVWVKLKA